MNDFSCMNAEPEDAGEIKNLLRDCKLPTGGIDPHISNFFIAKNEDGLAGAIGIEVYGNVGILRSFAVVANARGRGLGGELYTEAMAKAKTLGLQSLYLLTTTAEPFFAKRGWAKVERKSVPYAMNASIEFKGACPASATCMKLDLR